MLMRDDPRTAALSNRVKNTLARMGCLEFEQLPEFTMRKFRAEPGSGIVSERELLEFFKTSEFKFADC